MKAGDKLHGFVINKITDLLEIKSVAIEAEHTKSGAKLMHIANSNLENMLSLGFRTPPTDNTGLPHILEHTVLSGSQKYPVKEPFVELLKTSLATFINAWTFPDKTVYPVCSLNKKDFFNLAEVYCDACFYPLIDEEKFMREGHRFDFKTPGDPSTDLVINGVVYNEMKGAFSNVDGLVYRYAMSCLFPDNAYGFESGGDPDEISKLTYEDFRKFYAKYYHPSNCFIVVFGNIPTREHLKFLNNTCLSKFEKIEIDTQIKEQKRWNKPLYQTISYPIGKKEDKKGKTSIALSFFTNDGADLFKALCVEVLQQYLLSKESSPLKRALMDSGLAESLSGGHEDEIRDQYLAIVLGGSEPEHSSKIEKIVKNVCAKVAKDGLDKTKLLDILHQLEVSQRVKGCFYPPGVARSIYKSWLYGANPLVWLEANKHIEQLRLSILNDQDNIFEKLLKEVIVDNNHYCVLTFVPDNLLQEKKAKEFSSKMAIIKEKMSDHDLACIACQSKQLAKNQSTPDSPEALANLPTISLSDIPKDRIGIKTELENVGGSQLIYAPDIFTNGINFFRVGIELTDMNKDLFPYLNLFLSAMSGMGTEEHDYLEMEDLEYRHTIGVSPGLVIPGSASNPYCFNPYVIISSGALNRNVPAMTRIMLERILNSRFDDKKRLKEILLEEQANMRSSFISNGWGFAQKYASKNFSRNARLEETVSGFTQMKFLSSLIKNYSSSCEELIAKLLQIKKFILSRTTKNIKAGFVGEDAHLSEIANCVFSVTGGNTKADNEFLSNNFRTRFSPIRDAISFPCDCAFNALVIPAVSANHKCAPALYFLSQVLKYSYLWEKIRIHGGAYGARASYDSFDGLFSFLSYRDPETSKTFEVFENVVDFIKNDLDMSPSGIERLIPGVIKDDDGPYYPTTIIFLIFSQLLSGDTDWNNRRQKLREDILSLTKGDLLHAVDAVLEPGFKKKCVCTISNDMKIAEANQILKERGEKPLKIKSL